MGTVAALCSMTSFAPQIAKIWRDRDASEISLAMYLVTVTGFCLWIGYGVLIAELAGDGLERHLPGHVRRRAGAEMAVQPTPLTGRAPRSSHARRAALRLRRFAARRRARRSLSGSMDERLAAAQAALNAGRAAEAIDPC